MKQGIVLIVVQRWMRLLMMARYIEIKEAVRVVDMCFFIQGIGDDKEKWCMVEENL